MVSPDTKRITDYMVRKAHFDIAASLVNEVGIGMYTVDGTGHELRLHVAPSGVGRCYGIMKALTAMGTKVGDRVALTFDIERKTISVQFS
jgi:hypothetical protein